MYRGLCRDCRHAFDSGQVMQWTNDRWHFCAATVATRAMQRGPVIQCSDYQSKRLKSVKGIEHEYDGE